MEEMNEEDRIATNILLERWNDIVWEFLRKNPKAKSEMVIRNNQITFEFYDDMEE